MPHVQDAYLNSVLRTLSILSTIKSAHSRVRGETHFEICFVWTPRSDLVPYYCSEELIIKKNLFPSEELFITKSVYPLMRQSLEKWLSPIVHDEEDLCLSVLRRYTSFIPQNKYSVSLSPLWKQIPYRILYIHMSMIANSFCFTFFSQGS